ncbi:DNA segregation ATPase, FtsK/SpoIIIE family [Beggiatoa alba B18LD]|uniref:DNA segregation ATPase, FtsK/SpoIIIE family n=1 Tax=Beggiatoa alba B18LD TaxID=395493 RepID=I3CH66_9GAMM|nr:DNA translocase FtsK [Beggiatoa alba]EIJ42959.1 DNA segregation ATPase, FtsK/SpoIIIE family [Beggiatoa alba B18LD]
MSQARRTRKPIASNSVEQGRIKHGLREIMLILFCFIALYLFFSLSTYSPLDPGWSHSSDVIEVHNKGGVVGAWLADLFFYLFGYFAFLFPIIIGHMGLIIYKGRHHDMLANPKTMIVPGIGFILTLTAGCGLAIVHFSAEGMLLPSHAGGILGIAIGKTLQGIFSQLGATLLLIALFFTGVTLLTGLSWLKLMDTLGFYTLQYLPIIEQYIVTRVFPKIGVFLHQFFLITQKILITLFKFLHSIWVTARAFVWSLIEKWQARRASRDYYEEYEEYEEEIEDERVNNAPAKDKKTDNNDAKDAVFFDKPFEKDEETEQKPTTTTNTANITAEILETAPILTEIVYTATEPKIINTSKHVQNQPTLDIAEEILNNRASILPDTALLQPAPFIDKSSEDSLKEWMVSTLQHLGVDADVRIVYPGPVLLGFEIKMFSEVNATRLEELSVTLAQALNVDKVRMIETQTGVIGVEIPNPERETVYLVDILNANEYQDNPSPLTLALGKDVRGHAFIIDLTRVPHLLMAGSYPAEKQMLLHSFILSLLYKATPKILQLMLINSQTKELSPYDAIPHLLTPLIQHKDSALQALKWCEQEMERRYRLMADMGVRNIEGYNETLLNPDSQAFLENLAASQGTLPYIVLVVAELSELILTDLGTPIEEHLTRLAQKARAAGIHLILATQYPSVSVITGMVKSNLPTRIALQVSNKSESRNILGQMGAESLLGQGDMLYNTAGTGTPTRVHAGTISREEIQAITDDLRQKASPRYLDLDITNLS